MDDSRDGEREAERRITGTERYQLPSGSFSSVVDTSGGGNTQRLNTYGF